jgi:hypothetical protein
LSSEVGSGQIDPQRLHHQQELGAALVPETAAQAYFGTGVVAASVFILLAVVALSDAWFTHRKWGPLGYWVAEWSRRYPLWVLFFSFFAGALVGHFFTKPPIFS